jgi:hypothetical protein
MRLLPTIVRQIRAFLQLPVRLNAIDGAQQQSAILQAQILIELQRQRGSVNDLREVEFQVFSQYGEDGIIQYLLREIGPVPHTFVEFGVQNYMESNTRFLLMKDYWRGLIIDASESYMRQVRARDFHWRHQLATEAAFITRDNINAIIARHGFRGEIGLLSVDIDGNDYWVWEAINVVDPVIVVAEYNGVYGMRLPVTVPYADDFHYLRAHSTGLHWGVSLAALNHLAIRRGYALIGCNSAGNNAFFVKRSRLGRLTPREPAEAFRPPVFRVSRTSAGDMSFLDLSAQRKAIRGVPLVDVVTGQTISFDPDEL